MKFRKYDKCLRHSLHSHHYSDPTQNMLYLALSRYAYSLYVYWDHRPNDPRYLEQDS